MHRWEIVLATVVSLFFFVVGFLVTYRIAQAELPAFMVATGLFTLIWVDAVRQRVM